MYTISRRELIISLSILTLAPLALFAWSGPPAGTTPPDNNVAAPVNVGNVDQVKNGGLGLNSLAVFGNSLFGGSTGSNAYLNFGPTSGLSGYGIRDKDGTMEFKNLGETGGDNGWKSLQNIVFDLCSGGACGGGGGGGPWATSGNNIYNTNTGNVGIGKTNPAGTLDVQGSICMSGDCRSSWGAVGVPAGSWCGARTAAVQSSAVNYNIIVGTNNVFCQGNQLSATASGSVITSVSGCPAGYTGRWNYTGVLVTNQIYIIYCSKN